MYVYSRQQVVSPFPKIAVLQLLQLLLRGQKLQRKEKSRKKLEQEKFKKKKKEKKGSSPTLLFNTQLSIYIDTIIYFYHRSSNAEI
jgi:hypothetical protein